MLSRTQAICLVIFLVVLSIATYIERTPGGDDAWFAEQSYWFLKEGVIRSEYFSGLNDWDEELLVSHKLFLWFGSALMYFFGTELPVVQFTGLIPFVVLVAQLVFYLRWRGESGKGVMMPALLFLVFANRLLVKMSFQNRPEMLLAAFGFGAFLLLFTGKRKDAKVLGAGILSGLAFVAHMNGVIYLIAGFVTLALLKQYRNVLLFSIAGVLSSLLYLIDIVDRPDGFQTWLFQFANDPAASHGIKYSIKIIQLLTYPRMFFHSPEQLALSALFVYVLWHQWQYIRQLPAYLSIYTLTLFLSFWVITKGNSAMYMILFIPFMIVVLYEVYRVRPFVTPALKIFLAAYLVIGVFGMGQLIYKNREFGDLPEKYEALRKYMPEDGTGLVPLTFFFNEYEEYDQLLTHENYKLHYNKENLSASQMATWSNKMDVDFILYDYGYLREGYYPKPGQKRLPHYQLTFYNGRFAIYERI